MPPCVDGCVSNWRMWLWRLRHPRAYHRALWDYYEVYEENGRWHGKVWRDDRVVHWQDYGSREVADEQTRARYLVMTKRDR